MNTSNWGDFVRGVSARIDEIIDETKDMGPSFAESGLFRQEKTDGLIYRTKGVTGLNYLELFDEEDGIKTDRTYPAYETEYTMKQHGKVVSISQMLAATRMAELESKLDEVRQIRIAATRTLNKWAWQTLVDGFVTTDSDSNFPTARLNDGKALYATDHPSRVAGVSARSNRLSGDPVLTEANLFTAQKTIKEQLNGRGLPINYDGGYILVVPPALEKTAFEILKSQLRSGTTDNDINYFQGTQTDLVVSTYLGAANSGSDTAWYVFGRDGEMQQSLRYVTLIEPKIEQQVDFYTKSINVSIDMAAAFGYSNFELTAASDGTAD